MSTTVANLPAPWPAFLEALDARLTGKVAITCIGGFALLGILPGARVTRDLDFIAVQPDEARAQLLALAQHGSAMAAQFGVWIEFVTVHTPPVNHEARLRIVASLRHLTVKVIDPDDLALLKLQRFSPRDRKDLRDLIHHGLLHRQVLSERFEQELLPYYVGEPRALRTSYEILLSLFPAEPKPH